LIYIGWFVTEIERNNDFAPYKFSKIVALFTEMSLERGSAARIKFGQKLII